MTNSMISISRTQLFLYLEKFPAALTEVENCIKILNKIGISEEQYFYQKALRIKREILEKYRS